MQRRIPPWRAILTGSVALGAGSAQRGGWAAGPRAAFQVSVRSWV
jgi:hypothetical protein